MSEREKQKRFIKQLILADNSAASQELRARLTKAERDEHCIRSAVFLILFLALLSGAGLGYSAVLVPEFFDNSTPLIVKIFSALVLACGISLLGFSGFWWWYRGVCNRIYNECRNWIMALHMPAQPTRHHPSQSATVHKEAVRVYTIVTPQSEPDTQIFTFPHASV